MVNSAIEQAAAVFLCSCGDWAGEHIPAGIGPCEKCACEAFRGATAAEISEAGRSAGLGAGQTHLGDIVVRLPRPATFRVEFTRPISANRGSATISGVEAFAVLGPFVLLVVGGEIEAMIPVDRIGYVQGIEAGHGES